MPHRRFVYICCYSTAIRPINRIAVIQKMIMRQIFLNSLFLLLFSFGLNSLYAQKSSVKVLSYNMHHANPPSLPGFIDLPAIARVINGCGAELVALQEVDVHTERSGKAINQAAELGRLTGMHHYFVKGIDYQGGEYGIAILSKFPFLKTDSLRLPMQAGIGGEPRVLAITTIKIASGKKLTFACTHLDLKAENKALQAPAITQKLSRIKHPVILCGDFNAKPDTEVIAHFDRYFTRSSIPSGFTIPEKNPNREIDFVMYRPAKKFGVLKHEVIREPYASDHLPVYVELAF